MAREAKKEAISMKRKPNSWWLEERLYKARILREEAAYKRRHAYDLAIDCPKCGAKLLHSMCEVLEIEPDGTTKKEHTTVSCLRRQLAAAKAEIAELKYR